MTEDQQHMWDILTNDPERLCHRWAEDILNSKRYMHRRADYYIGIMLNQFSPEDAMAVIRCWLIHYQMPIDPSKLNTFDDFHAKFGNYIVNNYKNIKSFV